MKSWIFKIFHWTRWAKRAASTTTRTTKTRVCTLENDRPLFKALDKNPCMITSFVVSCCIHIVRYYVHTIGLPSFRVVLFDSLLFGFLFGTLFLEGFMPRTTGSIDSILVSHLFQSQIRHSFCFHLNKGKSSIGRHDTCNTTISSVLSECTFQFCSSKVHFRFGLDARQSRHKEFSLYIVRYNN